MNRLTRKLLVPAGLVAAMLFSLAPSVLADDYEIDGAHAAVTFKVQHLGVSYTWGRFNDIAGTFSIDESNPSNSSVNLEIKIESIDSANAKRDKHLRSPDFFNAKTFPLATFKSSKVSVSNDVYTVSGELEFHGVKKPVTIELQRVGSGKDPWGGYRTGFSGQLAIKRSDFGMTNMTGAVGDEVVLFIDIEGIRK